MRYIIAIIIAMTLASCSKLRRLPVSSSKPYEVTVIADEDSIITKILSAEAAGLPQPEPFFDVYNQKKLEGNNRLSRAIVIYDKKATKPVFLYNKYAEPQFIIRYDGKNPKGLRKALTLFEFKVYNQYLKRHHNREYEKLVNEYFNLKINIPAEMKSVKKAKDFIWISNNRAEAMQSIVICRGDINKQLKQNLKGETDSMYVKLLSDRTCGLWEMEGDAMGGPFAKRYFKKEDITVLGFVYAPERKKRNLMRQLQSVIHYTSIKHNKDGRK